LGRGRGDAGLANPQVPNNNNLTLRRTLSSASVSKGDGSVSVAMLRDAPWTALLSMRFLLMRGDDGLPG